MRGTQALFSRDSDEWETPQQLFDDLNKEFQFTLDASASEENKKCERYYSVENDGLKANWGGETVFCNPPYSQIKQWVEKAFYEGHKDNTVVVLLIPARTDTKWFHNYIQHRSEVRFIERRIRFSGSKINAPFPSMIVIFRGAKNDKSKVQTRRKNLHDQ